MIKQLILLCNSSFLEENPDKEGYSFIYKQSGEEGYRAGLAIWRYYAIYKAGMVHYMYRTPVPVWQYFTVGKRERYALPHANVMIHQPLVEYVSLLILKLCERNSSITENKLNHILASHSGQSIGNNSRRYRTRVDFMTAKQLSMVC